MNVKGIKQNIINFFICLKGILDEVAYIVGWFIVIIYIIPSCIINLTNILSLGSIHASVAIGTSEYPKIWPGDIIFIYNTNNLKVGDIGCYVIPSNKCSINPYVAGKGDIICHDVVKKIVEGEYTYYVFKGYANKVRDPCNIPSNFVLGKVIFRIPFLGLGVVPAHIFMKLLIYIARGGYV